MQGPDRVLREVHPAHLRGDGLAPVVPLEVVVNVGKKCSFFVALAVVKVALDFNTIFYLENQTREQLGAGRERKCRAPCLVRGIQSCQRPPLSRAAGGCARFLLSCCCRLWAVALLWRHRMRWTTDRSRRDNMADKVLHFFSGGR
jgi:hypothetical protein